MRSKREPRLRRAGLKNGLLVASLLCAMQSASLPVAANDLAWQTYNDAGDSFVKQQKYTEAEEILGLAIGAARELNSSEKLRASLALMIQVYDGLKQAEKADAIRKELQALGGPLPTTAASSDPKNSVSRESFATPAEASTAPVAESSSLENPPAEAGLSPVARATSDSAKEPTVPANAGSTDGGMQEIKKSDTDVDKLIQQLTTERESLRHSEGASSVPNSGMNDSGFTTKASGPRPDQIASTLPPVAASGTTATANEVKQLTGPFDFAISICFAPNPNYAASGGGDQIARYWDVASGKEIAQCAGHKGNVNSVSSSKDGLRIVTGGDDQTVRIFAAGSGQQEKLMEGHKNTVLCATFSQDMRRVASGSFDGAIIVWDAETGSRVGTLEGHTRPVRSVMFSPAGDKLVSASDDHTLIIWDMNTMKPLNVLKGHTDYVLSLDISEDGSRILSGGRDLKVRVWDLNSGSELQVMEGHKNWVQRVRFMKGGNQAMTGSLDKTVRIWDVSSGALQSTFDGFEWGLWAEDFAPDTKQVLTGSNDKTIRVWSLPN